jgi:hypothetical protein
VSLKRVLFYSGTVGFPRAKSLKRQETFPAEKARRGDFLVLVNEF